MKKLILLGLIFACLTGFAETEVMTLTGKISRKSVKEGKKKVKVYSIKVEEKEYMFSKEASEKVKSYYNKTVTIAGEVDTEKNVIKSVESVKKKSSSKKKPKKKKKKKSTEK